MIKIFTDKVLEFDKIVGENLKITTFEKEGELTTINNSNIKKIQFNNGETFIPKIKKLSTGTETSIK